MVRVVPMLGAHSRPAQRAAPHTRCEACGACSQYQRDTRHNRHTCLSPGGRLRPLRTALSSTGAKAPTVSGTL